MSCSTCKFDTPYGCDAEPDGVCPMDAKHEQYMRGQEMVKPCPTCGQSDMDGRSVCPICGRIWEGESYQEAPDEPPIDRPGEYITATIGE